MDSNGLENTFMTRNPLMIFRIQNQFPNRFKYQCALSLVKTITSVGKFTFILC